MNYIKLIELSALEGVGFFFCYTLPRSSVNLCVKVLENGIFGIYQKCTALTIRSSKVHGLIQHLPYAQNATSQTSGPSAIDEMGSDKEMHAEVFTRFQGCRNNQPNQRAHHYYNEFDPRIRTENCFNVVFAKVDIH